jgi:hypothetical protein
MDVRIIQGGGVVDAVAPKPIHARASSFNLSDANRVCAAYSPPPSGLSDSLVSAAIPSRAMRTGARNRARSRCSRSPIGLELAATWNGAANRSYKGDPLPPWGE